MKGKTRGSRVTRYQTEKQSVKDEISRECDTLLQLCSYPCPPAKLWENYLEINETINRIKALQEAESTNLPNRFDAVDDFMKWLNENGAEINGVSIHEFPDYGLGLKADADIKEDELFLRIPRKAIFTTLTAAPELKSLKSDVLIKHMPQVALAIALLVERKKTNSFWKPYLDMLPRDYSTVLYMSTSDMEELKKSTVFTHALKQCRNVARQYSYLSKIFQNQSFPIPNSMRDFTYEEYKWAVSTVMTRQNLIPNDEGTSMIHSLIPMWDMCNHMEGRITTSFELSTNTCDCYAMKSYQPGDQIFIYYGKRTNLEFFLHNGFVYPNNQEDAYHFNIGLSKSDKLIKERTELLSKLNLQPECEFPLKCGSRPLPQSLLAFLRICNMNESELNYWLNSNDKDNILMKHCLLAKDLDLRVGKFILNRLKLVLLSNMKAEKLDSQLSNGTKRPPCNEIAAMKAVEKDLLSRIIEIIEENYIFYEKKLKYETLVAIKK